MWARTNDRLAAAELRLPMYDAVDSTAAKSMIRHRKPPSHTCRAFLDNHVRNIVAIDSVRVRIQVGTFSARNPLDPDSAETTVAAGGKRTLRLDLDVGGKRFVQLGYHGLEPCVAS